MKPSFLTHTLSNTGLMVGRMLVQFAFLPIYTWTYGDELFGVYLLSFGFAASLSFLDMGAAKSLVRYSAEYSADGDRDRYRAALSHGLSLSMLAALGVSIIMLLVGLNVDVLFPLISPELVPTARQVFYLGALYAFWVLLGLAPQSMLQGFSLFTQRNRWQFVVLVGNIGLGAWVYWAAPPLLLFAGAQVALMLVAVGFDVLALRWYAREKLRGVRPRLIVGSSLFRGEFFRYTGGLFVLSLIGYFSQQSDRLVLGVLAGPDFVVTYTVITTPYLLAKNLNGNFYMVLQPRLAEWSRQGNYDFLRRVLTAFSRFNLLALGLLCLLGGLFFESFVRIWMDTEAYRGEVHWGWLALASLCLTALFSGVYRTLFISGDTRPILRLDAVGVALNVGASISLTPWLGIGGVIVGTSVQMLVLTVGFGVVARQKLGFSWSDYIPWRVLLLLAVAAVYILWLAQTSWPQASDWGSLLYRASVAALPLVVIGLVGSYWLGVYEWIGKKTVTKAT